MGRGRSHPHRLARILSLHALFMMDVGRASLEEALENVRQEAVEGQVWNFVEGTIRGISREMPALDSGLCQLLENWTWDRVARVDRNLLRLGAYELLHCPETAPAIVINEAVELARIYSDDKSPQFVNGLLDSLRRSREPAPP